MNTPTIATDGAVHRRLGRAMEIPMTGRFTWHRGASERPANLFVF
jgi:hypothetical protein